MEEWQPCFDVCSEAICCQDSNCLGDCSTECSSCIPCTNLGPPPTDNNGTVPEGDTCSVLVVDYYQGFNLHFPIDESDAKSLMPSSCFSPLQLSGTNGPLLPRFAHSDDSSKSPKGGKRSNRVLHSSNDLRKLSKGSRGGSKGKSGFYASFHAAQIGVEAMGTEVQVGRADLFTCAVDPKGEPSLVFIAAFQEAPLPFQTDPDLLASYKKTIEDLALDSRTGMAAYPHFFSFAFQITESGFRISGGDVSETIEIQTGSQHCEGEPVSFTQDFVLANSLACRSAIDKNINFFNKDFIAAKVKNFPADDNHCLPFQKIDFLFDLLPAESALESVQAYGSNNKAITWPYEDILGLSTGTPFLTLKEVEDRVDFKRGCFGPTWAARAAAMQAGTAESLVKLISAEGNLFLNWELSANGVTQLSDLLQLESKGFLMVLISIVSGKSPWCVLSLNACVGTFAGAPPPQDAGVRFECSVHVRRRDDPRPFHMIVQALSSVDSFDPVSGQANATNIKHSQVLDSLSIESDTWSARFNLKEDETVSAEKDWINANDVTCWSNTAADEVFFDTDLTLQLPVNAMVKSITGTFFWDRHLEDPQSPVHSFVCRKPIDCVIRPWFNLNSLPNSIPGISELKDVKKLVCGGLASLFAFNIVTGEQEPIVDLDMHGDISALPRLAMNFEIPKDKIEDMEKAISFPDEHHIIPMKMTASSKPRHTLTVAMLTESLVHVGISFKKATWTVCVENNDGHTCLHEFHVEHNTTGIDVEEMLKGPAQAFDVSSSATCLDISIKTESIEADFKVPFATGGERIDLADVWVHSHDKVLWKKGVYDDLHCNGGLWNAKVIPGDAEQATTSQVTPWSDLINSHPFEVSFFDADVPLVSSPWFNIEEINVQPHAADCTVASCHDKLMRHPCYV